MYKPLNKRVIVERIVPTKTTSSGIILQSSQEPERGRVIVASDGLEDVLQTGNELLLNWNKAVIIDKSKELYSIHIDDVIAVFED